jgi:signal transduction histidine kinase
MDRLTVELSALAFQAVFTLLLALVYWALWYRQRRNYFATWACAWALYAVRLGCIAAYIVARREVWLFAHQAVTGISALLLLLAALQFSRDLAWRWSFAWLGAASLAWAAIAIFGIHNMVAAGTSAVVLLSGVTLWTGWVFWQHRVRAQSRGGVMLAVTFTLWGLHHLDYPLLRPLGTGVLYGVFADVLFIAMAAIGTMFLVLSEGRRSLEARNAQLEQLTHLLLRSQEDERRRIARELHDEAGQVLTAVKIELDLDGRREASEMVGRALAQVRDLSNLLRPTVLDDLGLVPALRALVEDFARRTRIEVRFESPDALPGLPPDVQVALYRVLQEAITNVARHAGARRVTVGLEPGPGRVRLTIEDDGRGLPGRITPHLGLLGMRERVVALGGSLEVGDAPGTGVRVEASIPAEAIA